MRIPLWLGFGILAVLPVLAGCYGNQLLREPVTVDETARNVEATRQQQAALEQRLQALEKRVAEQADLLRTMKAEDASRWDELSSRLLALDSKIADALARRGGGSASSPSIWSASPVNRPSVSPSDTASSGNRGEQSADSGAAEPDRNAPAGSAAQDSLSRAPEGAGDDKRVYDQAYLDLNRGNYSLAVLGFREFLRRSPDSDLADNAQYWIGECYYAQRQFNEAIQEFLKVSESYPHGDKVPSALLKIGYAYLMLDDRGSARRYLNQVIEQFPRSEEAGLAKNKLRSAG